MVGAIFKPYFSRKGRFLPFVTILLPHQFVAVGVEGEGGGPAAFSADFGNLLLDIGGDGAVATAIAVIRDT